MTTPQSPALSVIIPTFQRKDALSTMVRRLKDQDVGPEQFEVIVVDDGSPTPVSESVFDGAPFKWSVIRQSNAGPARARNVALSHASGEYALFFNDDSIPAKDNLRLHLETQRASDGNIAVLGSFDFLPELLELPIMDLFQNSILLFSFHDMTPNTLYDGTYFWTCNTSVPMSRIRQVGGFDESFRHAVCEDTEIGLRLERLAGMRVLYRPDIASLHDHKLSITSYAKRTYYQGYYQWLLAERYNIESFQISSQGKMTEDAWSALLETLAEREKPTQQLIQAVKKVEHQRFTKHTTKERKLQIRKELNNILSQIFFSFYARGQWAAAHNLDADQGWQQAA